MATAPTKGRVLDHIGFEVANLETFSKKLQADGLKFDREYRKQDIFGIVVLIATELVLRSDLAWKAFGFKFFFQADRSHFRQCFDQSRLIFCPTVRDPGFIVSL